jgi:hypothetical protein
VVEVAKTVLTAERFFTRAPSGTQPAPR